MPINYTCCRALFDWMRKMKCLKQSCRGQSLEVLPSSATYQVYLASSSVLKSPFAVQTSILLLNI